MRVHRVCPHVCGRMFTEGSPVGAEPCVTTGFGFRDDCGAAPHLSMQVYPCLRVRPLAGWAGFSGLAHSPDLFELTRVTQLFPVTSR